MTDRRIEDLLRDLAPQVLGPVVRRYGHFDTAEDAVQEALVAAATQWPDQGVPDDPRAWLITVAARRLTDLLRAEQARRRREDVVVRWTLPEDRLAPSADRMAEGGAGEPGSDDTLILIFLCCHPALPPSAQIALTLRSVGGLTTAEVARAFLVSESTMTRRITRAKQRLAGSGAPFAMPSPGQRDERLRAVLHVLYLIFNEGYASTSGPHLYRADLATEAIRLTRMLHRQLPDDPEVAGLLALMLLTAARRDARIGPGGEPIPIAEQDRSRWDSDAIAEGTTLITDALPRGLPGPYQLQAAIAALHDEAPSSELTDWPQIVALYGGLLELADNPIVALNQAVALAMARGPASGLARLDELAADGRLTDDHRLHAARAHMLEMTGERDAAVESYLQAAALTPNVPMQRYLHSRAARLRQDPSQPVGPSRRPDHF